MTRASRPRSPRAARRPCRCTWVLGACAVVTLAGCGKEKPQETALRPGETRVELAGTPFGFTLPPGVALREDDPAITGEATKYDELAEGFAAFQPPRQPTVAEHSTSWFLTARVGETIPANRDDAVRAALETAPLQARVLGAEQLPGGGFLITTVAADRLGVHAWRPNGKRPWHCGGEDFRDPNFVAPPSWLDDPKLLAQARVELEAPCRSARVLR